MERHSRLYKSVVGAYTDLIRRFAYAILITAVLFTGIATNYIIENIGIDTDTTEMLSADLPFRKNDKAVSNAFPQLSDNLLVVVEGVYEDATDDAALALGKRMRGQPEVFGELYDLAADPFFRQNGLLYSDVEELEELGVRLTEAQPFLTALKQDPSLRGLFNLLAQALAFSHQGGEAPLPLEPVLEAIANVAEKQSAGDYEILSWQQLLGNDEEQEEASLHRRFLLLKPPVDYGSLAPADKAIEAVRTLAWEMGLTGEKGIRVRLTGTAILDQEELESVEEGMGLAGILSLTFVLILLMLGLRSSRLVLANLITLVMGLVWTAGFAVWAIGDLNLISVAFAVLFIGLSVDFGIHYSLRYKEARSHIPVHRDALREAAIGVASPLTLSAMMASIGFYSFLPTDYVGLAELGLIAGTGMFIALFANSTVLPCLLTVMHRWPSVTERLLGKERGYQNNWQVNVIHTRARPIVWGAVLLGVGALALLPQARFDFDPMNLKDPETESVSTLLDLLHDENATPYSATVLAANKEEALALTEQFRALPEVESARTILDFVPTNQDEKLETLEELAFVLGPALAVTPLDKPSSQDRAAARDNLVAALMAEGSKEAGHLARLLEKVDLKELEKRLLGTLPGRLKALEQSLMASPVSFNDLPKSLVEREVASDGRTKIEIYPKESMQDRDALMRFAAAVRSIAPAATGAPIIILEAGNTVLRAFRDAAIVSLLAITAILAVLLRSLWNIFLVFAPLVLSALLTIAASVLFNLPFNFANVIVLPLLFGLGVAGGIHLVMRERAEAEGGGDNAALETSTPRAVIFSSLTTIGSFGSIALSSHPGTSSMGVLLTIAIALTLTSTLLVLPALMALHGVHYNRAKID